MIPGAKEVLFAQTHLILEINFCDDALAVQQRLLKHFPQKFCSSNIIWICGNI